MIEFTLALATVYSAVGFALFYLLWMRKVNPLLGLLAGLALIALSIMAMGALAVVPVKEVNVQVNATAVEKRVVYGDNPWIYLFYFPFALGLACAISAALLYLLEWTAGVATAVVEGG